MNYRKIFSVYGVQSLCRNFVLHAMYEHAIKPIKKYSLQITGDIDKPVSFNILESWINLASELGTENPILYTTIINEQVFNETKDQVKSVNKNCIVASHGINHVHQTRNKKAWEEIEECRKYSDGFRFPYVNYNWKLLKHVSKLFSYDSSVNSSWMFPFKIGNMIEHPFSPPSDTFYNGNPVTRKVVEAYSKIVKANIEYDRPVVFLFHPNNFTVELMKEMLTQ